MKVVYCALELNEADEISVETVARISKLNQDVIEIRNLSKCTSGNRKRFAMLADLYLWTCKRWYGTYAENLIFVEFRGAESLPTLFNLQYSENIRIAISAKKLAIVDGDEVKTLKEASIASMSHFNEQRIDKIAPYISTLEKSYELLSCPNNPFR
jgi:hypothetical protein